MEAGNNLRAAGFYVFKSLFFGIQKQELENLVEYLKLFKPDSELIEEASAHLAEPEALELEYNRLCVGPYKLVAPPYESVYVGPTRETFTEATDRVLLCYQQMGLMADGSRGEPADFFGNELEFLYVLHARLLEEVDAEGAKTQELIEGFLSQHLGCWYRPFLKDIRSHSSQKFWCLVADEIEELIDTTITASKKLCNGAV
ncbi:Nitrate reductase delta subunit [Ferrimonas sediminum]|uniref:Nitrate reductase delta subunit n=1 Tax=Ferrimonas sediminum TaxID=718193 RepID=A0A1G8WG42_9GAMM|nr:molecular chaperone TorD family protein [Ferrimonas sediminum]SDJ77146.1 Nitrate reductase delta subunit [Ferrimonas sediminum]